MQIRRLFAIAGLTILGGACADHSSPLGLAAGLTPSPIISGDPDGNAHPYVGLLVFDDDEGPAWRCTGSLLSPTVVLTAGHCTDGAVAARIWMSEVVQGNPQYPLSGTSSYDGTPHTFPGFCFVTCANGLGILKWLDGDVGIVVLSEPVPTSVVSTHAQLPSAGIASTLPNGSPIVQVGYGHQFKLVGGGQPVTGGPLVRRSTTSTLISGKFYNSDKLLRLSSTSALDRGAACSGDSGGPNLVGNGRAIIAVISYGTNGNCVGSEYSMRIDRSEILSWIQSFLD
jgi:secreted trypsin-like serine protease